MKLDRTYTLKEICEIVQCDFVGDENHLIIGINEIHMVENGDIVFVDHPKYYDKALKSAATTIIINKEVECPSGKALIISDKPFDVFNQLTTYFRPLKSPHTQENQFIHPSAQIYPNVFIGNNVKI